MTQSFVRSLLLELFNSLKIRIYFRLLSISWLVNQVGEGCIPWQISCPIVGTAKLVTFLKTTSFSIL